MPRTCKPSQTSARLLPCKPAKMPCTHAFRKPWRHSPIRRESSTEGSRSYVTFFSRDKTWRLSPQGLFAVRRIEITPGYPKRWMQISRLVYVRLRLSLTSPHLFIRCALQLDPVPRILVLYIAHPDGRCRPQMAPSSLSFDTRPSTSSTLPPPCLGAGSAFNLSACVSCEHKFTKTARESTYP